MSLPTMPTSAAPYSTYAGMSTGFRNSMRSPLRGSVKINRRESWSTPSTPSSRRSSSARSSRRPFGSASVRRAVMSARGPGAAHRPRSRDGPASRSPGDEPLDAGQVAAHRHLIPARPAQERRSGGRLIAARGLEDERAGRTQVRARRGRNPTDHREAVASTVESKPRLVDPHLRRELRHERARKIRRIAHDQGGPDIAQPREEVPREHPDPPPEVEGA